MRSILMLISKNIKKKLLQSVLVASIILVTATTFSTAIGIMFSVTEPFKDMYKNLNGSYDILKFQQKNSDLEKIQTWWKNQDNVDSMDLFKAYRYQGNPIYKDKKLNTAVLFAERPKEEVNQDKLLIVQGDKKLNPEKNEVWIPTGSASKWNIKVGDTLSLSVGDNRVNLKVSAVVVDPQFSSGMFDPVRFWLANGEIKTLFNDEDNMEYHLGIIYKDNSKADKMWNGFINDIGDSFSGGRQSYSFIEYVYTIQFKIIASVLIVISVIIILIAIIIISFTIKNAVLYDYKTIGILKSQGFSNSNIIWSYCGQFSIIAIISAPLGILCGHFIIKIIMGELLDTVGIANVNSSMLITYVLTFIIILSVVVISSYLVSLKAGKIKPAEAIRYGAPPKNFTRKIAISIFEFKKLSLPLVLSIKQVLTNKRQSLFMFLIILTTIFMVTFMVNINNSLVKIGDNLPYWGFDNSEIQLARLIEKNGLSNEDLMNKLNRDDRIETVIPNGYLSGIIIKNEKNNTNYDVVAWVYEGDMNSIGILNIKGKNPVGDNEISLGINTSRKTNKNIGDYIEVWVKGKKKTFLVTGVFQTLNNGGEAFKVSKAGIIDLNKDYQSCGYSVKLKEGVDKKAFIQDIRTEYGDKVDAKESKDAVGSILDGLGKNISLPLLFIATIFIIVCFITIFNTIMINISEEKKVNGIYRALGFTSNQIRISILSKVIFLTLMGLIIGVPLAIMLPSKIVGLILSNLGMVEFPFIVTPTGTIIALLITTILIFISAWLPVLKIREVEIRGLIEE